MYKSTWRITAVILCISLMIVPCFGASYGTTVNYTSVKFPGASSANSVSGQYILVQAEDFLPYVCIISQYSAEFERYFTNNIYDLALIRFNNSTDQDYVVPVMRIGTAQPISSAPSTIQVNGRLIAWDGVNDPNFTAIDFPFNNSKTVTGVDFGTRAASFLLGCDDNNRVICCNNENGEYQIIQSIASTLSSISSNLNNLFSDNDSSIHRANMYLQSITNAILNSDHGLEHISSRLDNINTNITSIRNSVRQITTETISISDDMSIIIEEYLDVYFPQFDSDLDSIVTQLQYFYQSFQNYMASIDTHLENIDENVQAMHDEMSGEALKDFTVHTTDGQSPSLWQVIKNSLGWMMSPFGKFFSMIMDSTSLFYNAGNGWTVLYDITSASETYDPERIVVP